MKRKKETPGFGDGSVSDVATEYGMEHSDPGSETWSQIGADMSESVAEGGVHLKALLDELA
ncbi:MAG TPA: hypothetical protein VI980_09745 [Acidimicrobiia bacterium]|nr:hypothetical protein [Acidimicrobiia bacterium]